MENRKLPYINQSPSKVFIEDAKYAASLAKKNFEPYINAAAKSVGILPCILVGFLVIENDRMNPAAKSYTCTPSKDAKGECYVGLGQMGAETAHWTIEKQVNAGNIAPAELAVINKYVPNLVSGGKVGSLEKWRMKIYNALFKPEFAIWCTAMHIKQLLVSTNNRLDHVIVKYNRGIGNYKKEVTDRNLANADTTALVRSLNANKVPESGAYIVKFVGENGAIIQARSVGFA